MVFSSFQYLIFLPIVVAVYWRLSGRIRLFFVLAASYFFYMSWLPIYGLLLLAMTTVNWLVGLAIERSRLKSPATAKVILTGGIVANLTVLGYYKYTNFLLTNLTGLLNMSGQWSQPAAWHHLDSPSLNIILPLGISFFVFEFVHYLVDVYRGSAALRSWNEFAVFAAFFPSQIAGPIKRYQDFVERLRVPLPWSRELFFEAMTLIVQGLFKKVAIADPLGWIVKSTYANYGAISSGDALIAIFGFALQIFCDFSGYTDIGRGSALLLGIRLPVNFDLPYLAEDLAQFWRRWHMSLSFWIRDYVYFSLGGSRVGSGRTMWNLFITMAICGLWHGAAWQFPVWGALHGAGLIFNKIWSNVVAGLHAGRSIFTSLPVRLLNVILTFCFAAGAFALFRAPSFEQCLNIYSGLSNFSLPCLTWEYVDRSGVIVFAVLYAAFCISCRFMPKSGPSSANAPVLLFPVPLRLASWTAAVLIMIAARPTQATPFIYFQF